MRRCHFRHLEGERNGRGFTVGETTLKPSVVENNKNVNFLILFSGDNILLSSYFHLFPQRQSLQLGNKREEM